MEHLPNHDHEYYESERICAVCQETGTKMVGRISKAIVSLSFASLDLVTPAIYARDGHFETSQESPGCWEQVKVFEGGRQVVG